MSVRLCLIQQAGDQREVSDPAGDLVGASIAGNDRGEPISDSVQVGNRAVHIEPDLHSVDHLPFLTYNIA